MEDFKPTRVGKKLDFTPNTNTQSSHSTNKPSKSMKLLAAPKKLHWWLKNLSRKQLLALIIFMLVFIAGVVIGVNALTARDPVIEPQNAIIPIEPPKPITVASRMTGLQIAPELNNLPTTGVMIENSPDARPQAGLSQADMVYEAIAEGGITRFLALYQESQPDRIGPVRSVRPYYLDFLAPYDAAIVHAGGSAEALAQIRTQGIKDIDHGVNGSTFERASNRFAPHNLYTDRARLLEAHNRRGYTSSTYSGLARKEADTPIATPTARTIDFTISSFLYNPHYDYDVATNTYKRSEGGKPHVDERSGAQISPKVVVALAMTHKYAGIYSVYGVNGSGTAFIFQDGAITQGTWSKSDRKGQLVLKDAAGAILPLNPGQTWISLVTGADKVKFVP